MLLFSKLIRDKFAGVTRYFVSYTLSVGTRAFEGETISTERNSKSSARVYDDKIFSWMAILCTRQGIYQSSIK